MGNHGSPSAKLIDLAMPDTSTLLAMSFTQHRERFDLNKNNADPNKPPGYNECLSVIDMRPHRRKDRSRLPGMITPPTPSPPLLSDSNRVGQPNVPSQAEPGAGPRMNPASGNTSTAPLVPFRSSMYQQSPLSTPAQDVEVVRRANLLFDAVKTAWDDSDSERDSSEEQEVTVPFLPSIETSTVRLPPASEPPHRRKRSLKDGFIEEAEHLVKRSKSPEIVSTNHLSDLQNKASHDSSQQIRTSPHVPIYLAPASAAAPKPLRQGHIMKFDASKGVSKLPSPPSEPSIPRVPIIPESSPRQGSVNRSPNRPATKSNTNSDPVKVILGVPQYLPAPLPVIAPKAPSKNFNFHAPPPGALPPPVLGGFNPINGNGSTCLPSNHTQVQYSFSIPTTYPGFQSHLLPPVQPPIGTHGSVFQQGQQQARPLPPKNGTVLKLNNLGPAKEHAPRAKPPKNGTVIDFGNPAKVYKKR